MSEDILYDVADGIGTITFNRPQTRNAFTFAMYERVAEICDTVPTDGSVRVLIMTGAGDRAFAAGTDISQFRAFQTPEDALKYEARIDDVITRIERCAVPTIAAVAGACTGGGASIASACDLRVAMRSAKFGFPVARTLGNCLSCPITPGSSPCLAPRRLKSLSLQPVFWTLKKGVAADFTARWSRIIRLSSPARVKSRRPLQPMHH